LRKTASGAICISYLIGLNGGVGEGYKAAGVELCDGPRRDSEEETAKVYQQSKIVVNVTRDEFPPEA
jgi:hypothetical protein